jgi:hypothetical protein
MELGIFLKASSCAFTQELSKILWNPKVQYLVYKSTPSIPILNRISPPHPISPPTYVLVFVVIYFLLAFSSISYMHSSFHIPATCPVYHILRAKWVPFHHGMARPQVVTGEDGFEIWKIAANIMSRQYRTADNGPSSSLG